MCIRDRYIRDMKELQERLLKVQEELKAPKSRVNGFAKFNYRNSEDILEAVKPLLAKHGLCITIADQVHEIGEIVYIESTVVISYETERTAVTASAGIDLSKKGNDMGQRFGAASTYACLLYTSPSPRDRTRSRMPSSA